MVDKLVQSERQFIRFKRDRIVAETLLPTWAQIALYLLACITFPHEVSSRYPSPPSAPSDPIEAAQKGKLGYEHYTVELGVVDCLPELTRVSRLMLDALGPALSKASNFWNIFERDKGETR